MEQLNLTPSWQTQMRMCLMILENAVSPEALKSARAEIERCGELLDNTTAQLKELRDE